MIKIKTRQDQFAYQDFVAYVLRHGLYVTLMPNDSDLTIIVEDKSEAKMNEHEVGSFQSDAGYKVNMLMKFAEEHREELKKLLDSYSGPELEVKA